MRRRLIAALGALLAGLALCITDATGEPLRLQLFDWFAGSRDAALIRDLTAFFKLDAARLPRLWARPDGVRLENLGGAPAAIAWAPLDLAQGGIYTVRFEARWEGEGAVGRASASFGPSRLDFAPVRAWTPYAVTMRQTGDVGPSSLAFSLRARSGCLDVRGIELVRLPFDVRLRVAPRTLRIEVVGTVPADVQLEGQTERGSVRLPFRRLRWRPGGNASVISEIALPAGDVLRWQVVRDRQTLLVGAPVRLTPLPLVARGPSRRVSIAANGTMLRDGRPFFPMGLYLHEGTVTAVDKARESGVNLVLAPPSAAPDALVEAARKAGMEVLLETQVQPDEAGVTAAADALVKQYGALPVLGWTAVDEPDMKPAYTEAVMTRIHRTLAGLDGRPLYQANHTPASFWTVGTACDILAVDPYPVAAIPKPLTTVGQWIDEARAALGPGRSVWLIQQAFAEAPLWPVPPTPEQLRAMTWIALNHGARGIVYYAVHEILDPAAADHRWDLRRTPLWNEIARETAEIRACESFLVSRDGPQPLAVAGPFDAAAWEDAQGRVLVCVVNAGRAEAQATLTLPWSDVEHLRVAPDGAYLEPVEGHLAVRIPPVSVLLLWGDRPQGGSQRGDRREGRAGAGSVGGRSGARGDGAVVR